MTAIQWFIMSLHPHQILEMAADLLEQDRAVALCIIVKTRGSTPASVGAVMLVDDAAQMLGSVGGGCIEAEVRRAAFGMISTQQAELLTFKLDHDQAYEDGLICGGTIEVAVTHPTDGAVLRGLAEKYRRGEASQYVFVVGRSESELDNVGYTFQLIPPPTLLIAGGGHIGSAVTRNALELGFNVKVFDDRADILSRFIPAEAEQIAGPIHEKLAAEVIHENTFIVIATRGHRHDARALNAVIDSQAGYLGMIGSRRKIKVTYDDLMEEGVDVALFEKVHAPIGLDIGSVTIPEIAISIVAELIQVRRAQRVTPILGPEILT